nr:MAG TPA: stabilization protein [Caudoviricetes sp.]
MKPMYISQLAFTTGEISPDVSRRFDLDQFKSALLLAENAVIRPYGAVARRQGSEYIGQVKNKDKSTRLFEFTAEKNKSFLLEIGEQYIRVWRNGIYTGIELQTPFESDVVDKLNCIQSGDVMFICSGKYPVKTLSRYSDTDWRFDTYKLSEQPYGEVNIDKESTVILNGDTLTATKDIFNADMVHSVMQIEHYVKAIITSETGKVIKGSYDGDDERILMAENEYNNINYDVEQFSSDEDLSWKFTSHGTWNGTVKIQISNDNGTTWKDYRVYTSNNDYNVTDTGKVTPSARLKVVSDLKGGSVNVDLSLLPHSNYGVIEIKEFVDSKHVKVNVLNSVVENEATSKFRFGQWGKGLGYPRVCTFYQDRFILASSNQYPNYIWFSRTGDYSNFGVEKVGGTITDDSAITLPVINRKMYDIRHLIPANDLLILTSGNEWIIDGSKTITPTNCNLRTQTQRGASECEPQYIGNRCVYVQARGCVVRDLGYSYESDNYTGADLTLFVKHLTKYRNFITSAYAQDPDSIVYYVTDDGNIDCLTYIPEQKVYAWSHFTTKGKYKYAESVAEGEQDSLYVIVERDFKSGTVMCIERFEPMYNADNNNVYMDCYIRQTSTENISTITVPHLIGEDVQIVVNGRERPIKEVPPTAIINIDGKAQSVAVGINYTTRLRIPSIEMQIQDGTLQGRQLTMSRLSMNILNSFGGKIGRNFNHMDDILLPPLKLYSGDKVCILPKFDGVYSTDASVCILHEKPYPFNLLSVTREIEIGGGFPNVTGL